MNELQIFSNEEFGEVRSIVIDDEPWFVGKDVAKALGYTDLNHSILDHVDEEDRRKEMIFDGKQNKETTIINESGMYSLILSSKLPSAKRFKHWVTSEVLPSIRKNGGYINNQENLTSEQILANAVLVAQNVIAEKDKQIERMKPKEIFADAVSASETSILVGELAKLIKQNGVDIGQNRLFQKLRDMGYLTKKNYPTQKAMDLKLFEIVERTITAANGSTKITQTPKVTGKGQQYFINKFLKSS